MDATVPTAVLIMDVLRSDKTMQYYQHRMMEITKHWMTKEELNGKRTKSNS